MEPGHLGLLDIEPGPPLTVEGGQREASEYDTGAQEGGGNDTGIYAHHR